MLGVLVAGLLAAAIGFIAATWLSEASTTTRSAMTVGPLLLLISMSFILFGNKPQPFTPIIAGPAFSFGGVVISQVTVATVAMAIVTAIVVRIVLRRTRVGTQLRALSERPTTAELLGIRSVRCRSRSGSSRRHQRDRDHDRGPSQSNDATSLSMLIVPAAAAALLGGFRRLDLAVVGGIVLGVLGGLVAQIDEVALVRNFLPFLFIVVLLLWTQRKEVWDAAR